MPVIKRTTRGFMLVDAILATAVIGSLLALMMVWQQHHASQQRLLQGLYQVQQLNYASQAFVRDHQRVPTAINELAQIETGVLAGLVELSSVTWQLLSGHFEIRFVPHHVQHGEWLARKLEQGEWQNGQLSQRIPLVETMASATDSLLHRRAKAGSPELNRMETDLDMNQHAINNIGEVTATTVISGELAAAQASLDVLRTQRLMVGDSEFRAIPGGLELLTDTLELQGDLTVLGELDLLTGIVKSERLEATELRTDILYAEQFEVLDLTAEQLNFDTLNVGRLNVEEANVDSIRASYMRVNELVVDQLRTTSIVADSINTSLSSVDQNFMLAQQIQALWNTCRVNGGCG